jgi:hypothetical protein
MKTVENLSGSDLLLVSAKKVNGGKVQLEFAQHIDNPHARPGSIAGALNASDDRFNGSIGGPRRAWVSGQPQDIQEKLGVDMSEFVNAAIGFEKELNILNPTMDGKALAIQITETTEGTEYDIANFESRAKRAGKDGDFILSKDGEYIYVKSAIVPAPAKHVFMVDTKRGSEATSADDIVSEATE